MKWLLAGSALALLLAPTAHADNSELEFLQLLNMRGMPVYDTALALRTGYSVCERLNYVTGDVVVPELIMNSIDPITKYDAEVIVISAVQALCPWHDHSGRLT